MTSFYIATALERAGDAARVAEALGCLGWRQTYNWAEHGSVQEAGAARIREVAEVELAGVHAAQVCVFLLPGGRGTHVELGAALAGPGRVVLHHADGVIWNTDPSAPERTCAFYHHPKVERVTGTFQDLIAYLRSPASGIRGDMVVRSLG